MAKNSKLQSLSAAQLLVNEISEAQLETLELLVSNQLGINVLRSAIEIRQIRLGWLKADKAANARGVR